MTSSKQGGCGKQGLLRGRTFSAPRKSMKGKGRITVQFGCCYNYAIDNEGRKPGMPPACQATDRSVAEEETCTNPVHNSNFLLVLPKSSCSRLLRIPMGSLRMPVRRVSCGCHTHATAAISQGD